MNGLSNDCPTLLQRQISFVTMRQVCKIRNSKFAMYFFPDNNFKSFLLIAQNQPETRYVIFLVPINRRFYPNRQESPFEAD